MTFDLTLERIALVRRLVVAWNAEGAGAPMVHPLAPYGSTDRDGDIANVTGDDEEAEAEHRAVGEALGVFVRHAVLKPGRYGYHNPLAKLGPEAAGDVFRDAATGETPAQITFDVTAEHLALIPHLAIRWDAERDAALVDPVAPYGAGDRFAEMARILGLGPLDDALRRRLDGLHHEMQPALQIFTRYGDIAPGDF